MKRLTKEKQTEVIKCLCEGLSIRATVRMTGVAKNTIVKLLYDVADVCIRYQDEHLRNLSCTKLQCDEIWSFCYAKEKNVPADKKGIKGFGDIWTWTAICADTKIIPCWHVDYRDGWAAQQFMFDLASRLKNRVQLTTDGHHAYLRAVDQAFQGEIDYAMLHKIYGQGPKGTESRYSPPQIVSCRAEVITGRPKREHISTSFAERQNLTMRMSMRRFTRLTNAFSKKLENHCVALALYFMYYNFCRIHQTLRVTPAMEAGVANHVWEIAEIIGLLPPPVFKPRGPYKKRAK